MSFRVGLVGFGAIARDVAAILAAQTPLPEVSVLVRAGREAETRAALDAAGLGAGAVVTGTLAGFLDSRPQVVAECAGHGAVAAFGADILAGGTDLIVASVGALTDAALHARLQAAAEAGGAQLVIPSGAIGGIDALAAARLGGLTAVRYTGRKPPRAWAGTPAEAIADLSALTAPLTIFEGSARDAATAYPKNANVAATLALAGLGMDATEVRLVADPTTAENVHEFTILSEALEATVRLVGKPSPLNPKTSRTTGLSIARAILNRQNAIVI